jgi:hypothetical protein
MSGSPEPTPAPAVEPATPARPIDIDYGREYGEHIRALYNKVDEMERDIERLNRVVSIQIRQIKQLQNAVFRTGYVPGSAGSEGFGSAGEVEPIELPEELNSLE